MSSADNHPPPPTPPRPATQSLSGDSKRKDRLIITPASIARRAGSTTHSFSSIQPPPSRPTASSAPSPHSGSASSSLAPPTLNVIAPTPEVSPISAGTTPTSSSSPNTPRRIHYKSVPEVPSSALRSDVPVAPIIQKSHSSGSTGKRKAEEVEIEASGTPLKDKERYKTTFAPEPRTHRASASSHAPSSYRRKRARLSRPPLSESPTPSGSLHPSQSQLQPSAPPTPSRPSSRDARGSIVESFDSVSAGGGKLTAGSWSSKRSTNDNHHHPHYAGKRGSTSTSVPSPTSPHHSHHHHLGGHHPHSTRASSRRRSVSLSQTSIPISALISPHAPSVSYSPAYTFHMRDPRKPPPVRPTPWGLSLPFIPEQRPAEQETSFSSLDAASRRRNKMKRGNRWELRTWTERGGSPLHAWLFFFGFAVFPMWWVAAVWKVRRTRRLNGSASGMVGGGAELEEMEKGDGQDRNRERSNARNDGAGGTNAEDVVLDDPQLEYDAKSWRRRCRIMAVISLFTYIPFIVLVIVFAR